MSFQGFEIDPFYWQLCRWFTAGIFALALTHKLGSLAAFESAVRGYELVPTRLAPAASRLIVLLEAGVVIGLAGGIGLPGAAALAAVLLAIYASAMAINLARGRRHIDCGCFGPAAEAGHTLSGGLLLRNAVLILVSASLLFPAAERALTWLDVAGIAAATAAGLALYAATDQLLANAPRLRELMQ
ncbi:MAG TPA: MauE/DoxX family redox-associated membrane protein [Woeseiaceae bacterium]|nr:MauE/DoxX family redox-associated membrane protein [Woeseiaceae bacterium]